MYIRIKKKLNEQKLDERKWKKFFVFMYIFTWNVLKWPGKNPRANKTVESLSSWEGREG